MQAVIPSLFPSLHQMIIEIITKNIVRISNHLQVPCLFMKSRIDIEVAPRAYPNDSQKFPHSNIVIIEMIISIKAHKVQVTQF